MLIRSTGILEAEDIIIKLKGVIIRNCTLAVVLSGVFDTEHICSWTIIRPYFI